MDDPSSVASRAALWAALLVAANVLGWIGIAIGASGMATCLGFLVDGLSRHDYLFLLLIPPLVGGAAITSLGIVGASRGRHPAVDIRPGSAGAALGVTVAGNFD